MRIAGVQVSRYPARARARRRREHERGDACLRVCRRHPAGQLARRRRRAGIDDVAYAYLPGKGRVRVALVTSGNAELGRILRLLPRLDVEVIVPSALRDTEAVRRHRVRPVRAERDAGGSRLAHRPARRALARPRQRRADRSAPGPLGTVPTRCWPGCRCATGRPCQSAQARCGSPAACSGSPGAGRRAAHPGHARGPAPRRGELRARCVELPAAGELPGSLFLSNADPRADARSRGPWPSGSAGERADAAGARAGSGRGRQVATPPAPGATLFDGGAAWGDTGCCRRRARAHHCEFARSAHHRDQWWSPRAGCRSHFRAAGCGTCGSPDPWILLWCWRPCCSPWSGGRIAGG